jgi:hypothetical protein
MFGDLGCKLKVTPDFFFQWDDTRGCNNTIRPPEDEHGDARNM